MYILSEMLQDGIAIGNVMHATVMYKIVDEQKSPKTSEKSIQMYLISSGKIDFQFRIGDGTFVDIRSVYRHHSRSIVFRSTLIYASGDLLDLVHNGIGRHAVRPIVSLAADRHSISRHVMKSK